jgi:UDP-N-acetylmuramate dehydrogenase
MENFNLEKQKLNKKKKVVLFKNEFKNKNKKKITLNLIITIILIFLFCYFFFIIIINNNKNNIFETISPLSKKSLKEIDEEFIINLKKILENEEIIENEIMSKHTTFKIGGPAKYFLIPKTYNQIIEIIELCHKFKVFYFILGNGSNLLVSDEGYYGVIIQIHENNFSTLEIKKEDENSYILRVGGGMLMKALSIEACLLSLTGLEDIIDIPGTVGGGIIMNASFKGTGLNIPLIKVKAITPEGKIVELTKEECELTHRGSKLKTKKYIVIEATFRLSKGDQLLIQNTMTDNTKMRYEKQPMYFGSAGCFFVWNHHEHGGMYEKYKESDLVGYRVGNAMVYTYNIAFIVNLGKGKGSEVMEIVMYIEKIMKEKYKIEIKREVDVIGAFKDIIYY